MPHPRFKPRSLRPSPAMLVAVTALFFALAGAGYAATLLPRNSVGNRQLKNNSVSNAKLRNNSVGFAKMRHNAIHYFNIKPHSVGTVRIVPTEVQARVNGTCASGAISAISQTGTVTCATPAKTGVPEFDSGAAKNVALGTSATGVALFSLNGGSSYLVQANPYITVTPEKTGTGPSGADQDQTETVNVSCTLAVGSTTVTENAPTINVVQGGSPNYASIPMTLAVPSSANAQAAHLTCQQTTVNTTDYTGTTAPNPLPKVAPDIEAQGTIFALATAAPASTTTTTTTTPAPSTTK